ncbi:L-aspartate oxidase [Vreelandella populi]|uniref:L-aspartate oxidase n=1 Tax=Vreelandella populi TaxID=2498858 RepID=A0A433L757_9GAMM|nr:L-aspartate oxidase [Halomonas populi]RUR36105.1 L-aspartate oxidase [Halomonas populi]RUR43152.1 L-aspartate oxidase [Halomonas populi]RUR57664.1 L-aspartate oxidase [Halomonas populi]
MSTPTTDILVIGGGVAGLTLALEAADHLSVTLVRPLQDDKGASKWAQGGIAAALSPDDSLEAHVQDTLVAGDGLCDEQSVRFTVNHGPAAIQWLIDNGVPFTTDTAIDARYPYHLTREGGHNARRIIHADDATGRAVVDTLMRKVALHPNISQRSDLTILELLQDDEGRCRGAYGVNEQHQRQTLPALNTVLATGGASGLYRHTTTPSPSSGEGMMMAAELGAQLMNLEFQQFHPTSLYDPDGPAFLISEAVRGEGGYLLDEAGERFMPALDPRAELAPRDVVARAIDSQIQQGHQGHVWLDIRHLGERAIHHHFPTIYAHCLSRGIDITQQPIPVVPAAHYSCGGVATDERGATRVPGLYAIGEVACTGLHGANRMASNSLLECLVYARSCAGALREQITQAWSEPAFSLTQRSISPLTADRQAIFAELRNRLRGVMSQHVSIVRSNAGLTAAQQQLTQLYAHLESLEDSQNQLEGIQLHQTLRLAQLTVAAAMKRHESRGLHYSTDWPSHQPHTTASCLMLADLMPGPVT